VTNLRGIRGLLIDLDGTLYIGDRMIEGAASTIASLRSRNLHLRFTTNTTTRSVGDLHRKLIGLGLSVEPGELFGVIRAAQLFLQRQGNPRCHLLLSDSPREDFKQFVQDDRQPDYIIIGDIGKYWDYELMNRLFRMVMNGAEMVALHKGKYWQTENGLQVDIGAFVAGLEYVTGRQAIVIGKPSASFFQLALDDLRLRPEQVAMVGDDISSDIGGAQAAGMKGVLVRTGKYREKLVQTSAVRPDTVIDSIANLPDLLE